MWQGQKTKHVLCLCVYLCVYVHMKNPENWTGNRKNTYKGIYFVY